MGGQLEALDTAADIDRVGALEQAGDTRVVGIRGAEHLLGLLLLVGPVDLVHVEHSEHHSLRVSQRQLVALVKRRRRLFGQIQNHRHRPDRAVRQPHVRAHRAICLLTQEATERRERSVQQQLEVADLPVGQVPGGEACAGSFQLSGALGRDQEIDKLSAVRRRARVG